MSPPEDPMDLNRTAPSWFEALLKGFKDSRNSDCPGEDVVQRVFSFKDVVWCDFRSCSAQLTRSQSTDLVQAGPKGLGPRASGSGLAFWGRFGD